MRNLQYLLLEQIAVTSMACYGLRTYVAEDAAIEGGSPATDNFLKDLDTVTKNLEECRRLLLKHAATPSEVVG